MYTAMLCCIAVCVQMDQRKAEPKIAKNGGHVYQLAATQMCTDYLLENAI